ELLAGVCIEGNCTDRDFQDGGVCGGAVAIGAFTVASATGLEFAVVAVAEQGVVVRIRFEVNIAAVAAIAPGWAAARDVFLPAEGDATIAAVAGLDHNFGFVSEHL